jgi:serine/threonine-protein kinase
VPLIQAAKVPSLPGNLTGNTQFAPFATAIFDLIVACMQKSPAKRLTADQLVQACEDLYYSIVPREFGKIKSFDYGSWGFTDSEVGDDVFYHIHSVYAASTVSIGDRVWMTAHPGMPRRRAFPLVRAV